MKLRSQTGLTLVETAVAAAIVAVAAGAALYGVAAFAKYAAQQDGPARSAALVVAQQALRVAQDAWKYGSPGSAPSGTQSIALPASAATTAPATLRTTISSTGSSAQLTVTVTYTPQPGRNDPGVVSVSASVVEKAPLPGSQVYRPGLIPMPSGAP